ncbi:MAG TPA: hypothetical protein VGH80_08555 [Xanthomonadaceae bacterium]|jgi:hypothetical protein
MGKRDIGRLLRRTNVEDLLDDGIENGSDLKSRKPGHDDADEAVAAEPPKARRPSRTPRRKQEPDQAELVEELKRRSVSWFGVALGACLVVSGILVFAFPQAILVYHASIRRSSFVEYVSPAGSQAYGVVSMILGAALLAFSLYRPRR